MAGPLFFDRVMETTTTFGTGTVSLEGAIVGYQTFAVVGNTNTCYYCIEAVNTNGVPAGAWEVGIGTYASGGPSLARTTVFASSNAGTHVNFATGTKRVYLILPAAQASAEVTAAGTLTANALLVGGGAKTAVASTITDTAGALGLPDNVRQIFNPGVAVAGLNVGAVAADPSTPINGDLWYDSVTNELKARVNGATVVLA